MTYEFDTSPFHYSHGKEPRGYGSWAFEIEGHEPVWAPVSTYSDAKIWAKQQAITMAPAGYAGRVMIKVCP